MSLLDLVLIAIIAGSVVLGFLAGFARAGISFLAAISGILFGFWFYGIPAAWIETFVRSRPFANVAGFLIVFVTFVIAGALVGKILAKFLKWTGLSWLDRILGAGFGVVRGALAAVALVAVLMAFTPKPLPKWMVGSVLLPYAIDASNICAAMAPRALKDAVRTSVREIREAWDEEVKRSKRRPEKSEPKVTKQ